jgi:hypothetical protein
LLSADWSRGQFGTRQVKIVTIPGHPSDLPGERDNGKSFLLVEMPARPAEKWAARVFLALAHARADIPPGIAAKYATARGNMQQVSYMAGLLGHLQFPEMEPLLDELMGCVSFLSSPGPPPVTRPLHDAGDVNDDIAEIATRQHLRAEVLDLHVGFFMPAAILHLIAVGSTMREISEPTSSNTPTSRRRSRR